MRATLVPLLLASLLLAGVPTASAGSAGQVAFVAVPALGATWEATVPSRGPVWIEVVVTSGLVSDLVLDAPGACSGAAVSSEPVAPGAVPFRVRIDCGDLQPANVELGVSVLTGAARGFLVLHGMHINE